MSMKKFVGKLFLIMASVCASMVLVFGVAGCQTTHDESGIQPHYGSVGEVANIKVSGELPKSGDIVWVIAVIARETEGPYERLVIWELDNGGDVKVARIKDGYFKGLDKEEEPLGSFLVQNDPETVIKFLRVALR